ncbi:MAG: VCBS repeat-containing protein [Candidatus Sumerlaeaceae bacterium]|nr:VCBS repeat-containing protein [Candidatus Sumerlaeaceae bacterium]
MWLLVTCLSCFLVYVSRESSARQTQWRQVNLPVSTLSPVTTLHPVDLWDDERDEFVLATPSGSLEIFGWEGEKLSAQQKIQLPLEQGEHAFFTFARLFQGTKRSLVFQTPSGLFYWPITGNRFDVSAKRLIDVQLPPADISSPNCQYFEMAFDLNGDGLDELLIPSKDRFIIFRAREPLRYSALELPRNPYKYTATFDFRKQLPDDPVRVSSISGMMLRRRGVDDLVFYDANQDGREDLVYTSIVPAPKSREIERYEVFLQRQGFTFSDVPDQVIDVPFDERAYVTFRDFDGDGRSEAFVVTSNYDIVAPRTLIRILGGSKTQTTSSQERFRLITKDPIGLVKIADFNGDGRDDFACTFFSYQFASTEDIASLVAANRVRFKLQFYIAQPGKLFSRQPSYEFELNLSLKPESYGAYPPFYFLDDMNGDHIPDLVARADETRVAVYLTQGRLAYSRQANYSFQVPSDAALSFTDCNGDGRQDIIVTSIQKQSVSIFLTPLEKGQ